MLRNGFTLPAIALTCLILCLWLISAPACANWIGVTINDPGCRCAEDGATDASHICTHDPTVSLTGSAGVRTAITGSSVRTADLRYIKSPREGSISINITEAATRAHLEGTVNIDRNLSSETIYINGYKISGGATAAATVANINAISEDTGILASLSGSNMLNLTQTNFGACHYIHATSAQAFLGANYASAQGADAEALVTYQDGTPVSDEIWPSGCESDLCDQYYNRILLVPEALTQVGNLGPQIEISHQSVTRVSWTNLTNHATGECSGTTYWTAQGVPLSAGGNIIRVTATNAEGDSGNWPIAIDRFGVTPVIILSPTSEHSCSVHSATIDVSGTADVRDTPSVVAVPTSPSVISADISHTTLKDNEHISVRITQPMRRAAVAAIIPYAGVAGNEVFTLNGVTIPYGRDVPEMIRTFDRYCFDTGTIRKIDNDNRFALESTFPGSVGRIEISNAAQLLGFENACMVGADAIAQVTDSTGADISDPRWDKGIGSILKDSLGNTITLTDSAASTSGDLGALFSTQTSTSTTLTWINRMTGDTGACVGLKNWVAHNVPLTEGDNKIVVQAKDESREIGSDVASIQYFVPFQSAGEAIRSGHRWVSLTDQIVTAGSTEQDNYFQVEAPDRTGGMPVIGSAERGGIVTVDGEICSAGFGWFTEIGMWSHKVTKTDTNGNVQPLGFGNKALAVPERGMRVTGLLVRVWGKVGSTNLLPNSFTIDDGSGKPIICHLPDSMTLDPSMRFAGVTGIASTLSDGRRVIRIRDNKDVVPY